MTDTPRPAVLAAHHHEHFLEHGYVLLRGLVPASLCETCASVLERKEDATAAIAAVHTDDVMDAIGELFGEHNPYPRSRRSTDMVKPFDPATTWSLEGESGAHIDASYPTLTCDSWAVGVWVFLTPVAHRGGAFLFAPGSPVMFRDLLLRGPVTQITFGFPAGVAAAGGQAWHTELRELIAEPGDVMIFHHLMGHSGSPNVLPTTRHALLSRHAPHRRMNPDDPCTVARANDVQAVFARHGRPEPLPVGEADPAPWGSDVVSHALVRFGRRFHRFWSDGSNVRISSSSDLRAWEDGGIVVKPAAPVRSVSVQSDFTNVFILSVADIDGTTVYRSADLAGWMQAGRLDGVHVTCIVGVDPATTMFCTGASGVERRVGGFQNVDEVASWPPADVPATATRVDDATVWSILGEWKFALVGDGPVYALSDTGGVYGEVRPLPLEGSESARSIRLVERARLYWLVNAIIDDRVCWAEIDWEPEVPVMRVLADAVSMHRAMRTVGWI